MSPEAIIDEIRGRIDIVAVIGRHMELKRSGRTWSGCCVFHGERTPSFHVYPEDKHFMCYGCGERGDVFTFLQKLQGKEFPEIVRALALEVGVAIPEREEDSAEQRRRREERTEVLAACDAAARYFAARLASRFGEEGRSYLASRRFSDETAKLSQRGVAANEWDDLTERLAKKSISTAALEKAGLVARRDDGRPYDRFRGRFMFPLAGMEGGGVGFGGGREQIRRARSAVMVEGYFDVIGLHQVGVKNAVAVCGTALTPEHVELLRRIDCRTLTLLFDGDAAGVAAATKAATALLPSGIMGKVALLPRDADKTDPDEFARTQGTAAVEELISSAVALTDYLIDRAVVDHCGPSHKDSSFEQRMRAYGQLKPLIEIMPSGFSKTTFEETVAKRLDVSVDAMAGDMGTARAMEARPWPGSMSVHTPLT